MASDNLLVTKDKQTWDEADPVLSSKRRKNESG